jgi:hypothetical protein
MADTNLPHRPSSKRERMIPLSTIHELREEIKRLKDRIAELEAGYISDTDLREIAVELRRRMVMRRALQSFV